MSNGNLYFDESALELVKEVYDLGGGTEVIANPTLVGDEPDLTGLEVDGTKYAVPQGSGIEYVELTFNLDTTLEISITQEQATSLQNGAFIKATESNFNTSFLLMPTDSALYSTNIIASVSQDHQGHYTSNIIVFVADIHYDTLKVNFSQWILNGTRVNPVMPE